MEVKMLHGEPQVLEDRRPADPRECNRLRNQLYTMVDEWEQLMARRKELQRQFIENDLRVSSGPRKGQSLSPSGRRQRMAELLVVCERARYLERALGWVERRRNQLLEKLFAKN